MISRSVRFNGWTRLWILLSVIWVVIAAIDGVSKFNEVTATRQQYLAVHRPAFFDELPRALRDQLVLDDLTPAGDQFFLIRGDERSDRIQKLRVGVTEEQQQQVWNAYVTIADRAYRQERRSEVILEYTLRALIPCIVVGALGLAVFWVVRGFRSKEK